MHAPPDGDITALPGVPSGLLWRAPAAWDDGRVSQHPNHLVERMRAFQSSIFAEMTGLATSTGSINLGQGYPDYDGPQAVLEAAVAAIRAGHNQYPPSVGILPFRQAIAAHEKRFYDLDYDPVGEIVATTGATEGLAAALQIGRAHV